MTTPLRTRYVLAAVAVAATLAAPVQAQYTGPSTIGDSTVAAILAKPVDDQAVQIQGYLVRQTAHDKYVFSDGTAEIVAEIKAKRFPAQAINEKTKVELIGEVDTGRDRPPEIEVDTVRVVQ